MEFDFSGWATRNNVKCSDGRVIMKDAFKHNDGQKVPLVWNHQHNDPFNVLGHAVLENREEGVYAYCMFNNTESGRAAKETVEHGDICALSIYANQLQQQGPNVIHGAIREVSLVHAGANPEAFIDSVIKHGEASDSEAIIYTGEKLTLSHSDDNESDNKDEKDDSKSSEKKNEMPDKETIAEVFDTLTDKQKNVVYAMVGMALEEKPSDDDKTNTNNNSIKEDKIMKHNVFDQDDQENKNVIKHSEMTAVIADGKRHGSMRESALAHGIENIEYLFPDARNITDVPTFIKRDTDWVQKVMNGTHHTPFARVKSMHANLTEDEARAKGYIKGKLKKEEVFSLLKRTTDPTTVYKKQKMERDDIVDITDFDVVAWIKTEMRMMLDEELARAILVGDGRLASSDDKINENNIRPIWKDADLYTIKSLIKVAAGATASQKASEYIDQAVRARKEYKGSGSPSLFAPETIITECLLLKDNNGRRIYKDLTELATAMMVKEIIPVPVMENLSRTDSTNGEVELMGIIVNLSDYNNGADKGGSVNMFEDFDIDYNAEKYLIETRCSGALVKPYSAIALEIQKTNG